MNRPTCPSRWINAIQPLFDERIVTLETMGGGRNSLVFRCDCADGEVYVAKLYFRHPADPRDRQRNEWKALDFLARHCPGVTARPLKYDSETGVTILSYLPGFAPKPEHLTTELIDQITRWLTTLHRLADLDEATDFQPASEACFSLNELIESITRRLHRLENIVPGSVLHEDCRRFVTGRLQPFFERTSQWARSHLQHAGMEYHRTLPDDKRTLSPSDYGFHNAIIHPDGTLHFLDFEYFGWDDPAKMICDFLHHPAVDVPFPLRQRFLDSMCHHFSGDRTLPARIRVGYHLFGLKWCLILLNEFLPVDARRRQFAAQADCTESRLVQQLNNAAARFDRLCDLEFQFPYSLGTSP